MKLDTHNLKKLAKLSIQNGEINDTIATFVSQKLNNLQLKKYIAYLKIEIAQTTVYVTTADVASEEFEVQLKNYFRDNTVIFDKNETLGAGLAVRHDDMIIDVSLKNMIENTVNTV